MLSGMNAAPELITISATVDEYDASQTHVVGLFTDDVWASEYRLEIDLDADGQGDHLENITGPAFGFTTRL